MIIYLLKVGRYLADKIKQAEKNPVLMFIFQ